MDEMRELELFASDLTPEAQQRVAEFYGVKDMKDLNYDVLPFATLYYSPDCE